MAGLRSFSKYPMPECIAFVPCLFVQICATEPRGTALRPTSVYIIECAGYVKIGVSHRPHERLSTINTAVPILATLYGVREFDTRLVAHEIESRLHRKFRALRTNGEWFDLDPETAWKALTKARALKLVDPSVRNASRWGGDTLDNEEMAAILTGRLKEIS